MSWIDGFAFELSEEEQLVQQTTRNFATKEVLPLAEKVDREHYFPKELIPQLAQLGFMGVNVPTEYGGSDLSSVSYCLIVEEIAAACASTSVILCAHNSLCLTPIIEFGTEQQKQQYLPKLASGTELGCFSLSEPGTGSDAAHLTCRVEKKGDDYFINGAKNWVSNGPVADVCVLFAMQDRSKGHRGVTAFVHRMDEPGITRGKLEDKMGICGSPTCGLTYDNVKLSADNLLGAECGGFKVAMGTLNGGRISIGSQAVGIARAALKDALGYSKDRKAFGKYISEHQSIQNYLADMVTSIDAARYLTMGAARLKDDGKPYIRQAAMAKLFASEVASNVAAKGVQIHGGYGYVKDYPAERHMRDAKITEIYEGTSEIQRIVVAGDLLKE
ncbi:acyl-CoA dehydrogenase [Oligoflexia bacterium]|nr:acyl-CoA dehydrogenase [Oligoflexia bacterium]